MALRYTTRPISDRTWQSTKREQSRFTATWTDTLDLLEREYGMLRGRDLVIEVDVRERDIRNDGLLRADARAASPAVVVAFESKHGPLLYRCDRYVAPTYRNRLADWQHNVRAIALTLEALRAVDRYGASASGEQYRGYKAIESNAMALPQAMTIEFAYDVIARFAEAHAHELERMAAPLQRVAINRAQRRTHPDHGGNAADFQQVQAAADFLRREGRLS